MILIILVTVWFAALAALAVRIAIVRRERTGPESWERSPHLLDAGRDSLQPSGNDSLQPPGSDSLQQAINEAMSAAPEVKATPVVVSSSEPAAAEHVRDGAQEDLYVGP